MPSWSEYIQISKHREPQALLIRAMELAPKESTALDLGCGAGIETLALTDKGFHVEAVDSSPDAIKQTRLLLDGKSARLMQIDIADFIINPNSYGVIVAWNSLPFLPKEKSERILKDIEAGLVSGGCAVLSLFGPHDEWVKDNPQMSGWSTNEFKNLWPNMEFITLAEEEKNGLTAKGDQKYWHIIKCLAKKL